LKTKAWNWIWFWWRQPFEFHGNFCIHWYSI